MSTQFVAVRVILLALCTGCIYVPLGKFTRVSGTAAGGVAAAAASATPTTAATAATAATKAPTPTGTSSIETDQKLLEPVSESIE